MTDNNISHHDINEETQFKVNKERHEAKKRKFRPKTRIQRLKGVFYIFTAVWVVCQGISALLASTGFYHLASTKLNGNSFLISSTVLCFCIGLELSFNKLNKMMAGQKYDDKTPISPILWVAVLSFGLFYAGSTFIGTPFAVQFLAATPNYNDIEQITDTHNKIIEQDTLKWSQKRIMAQSSADAFLVSHGKRDNVTGKWRCRTGDLARHNELLARVDSVTYPADVSLSFLVASKKLEVKTAKEENKIMKADHLAWCGSFGWGLSFVSLGCIAIFLMSFSWCQGYERDEIKDNESMLLKLEEAKAKEEAQERAEIEKLKASLPKAEDRDKGKEPPKVVVNEPSMPMGFVTATIKEGDILKGKGRKSDRVYVEVKGELRAMTKGEVNTLKKGQSTEERITHLEKLRNKLN